MASGFPVSESNELAWRKSSFSQAQSECIEISESIPGTVPVRDSKDPEGPVLIFPAETFASFVAAVKSGQLPMV